MLSAMSKSLRLQSVNCLGTIGPSALLARAKLEELYYSCGDRLMGAAVLKALNAIVGVDNLDFLRGGLRHDNKAVREAAAEALPALGRSGYRVLREALEDPRDFVRASVAQSVPVMPRGQRAALFNKLFNDESHLVRLGAIEALCTVGIAGSALTVTAIHQYLLRELKTQRGASHQAASRVMGTLNCYSKEMLDQALQSDNPRVRLTILKLSGDFSYRDIIKNVDRIRRENRSFRKEVIQILGRLQSQWAEKILETIFHRENRVLQINIVLALQRRATDAARSSLIRLYHCRHVRVKGQILLSLGEMSQHSFNANGQSEEDWIPVIKAAMADKKPVLARAAMNALGRWSAPSALPFIEEGLAHSKRSVRIAALTALSSFSGPEARQALEKARDDRVPSIRLLARLMLERP
jgi:HEAT repeat protein